MDKDRDQIQEAKRRMPLPALIRDCGGVCPDDGGNHLPNPFTGEGDSFSVFYKDGSYGWKDHRNSEGGDEITFIEKKWRISTGDAIRHYLAVTGVISEEEAKKTLADLAKKKGGSLPTQESAFERAKKAYATQQERGLDPAEEISLISWDQCVGDLTDEHIKVLAEERGLDMGIFSILRRNGQIGLHARKTVAFPVPDRDGKVNRIHYRFPNSKNWGYAGPKGELTPLILGCLPEKARKFYITESQWDGIAVLTREDPEITCVISTRGASNGKLVEQVTIPRDVPVGIVMQNDKPKQDGSIPAENWYRDVVLAVGQRDALYRMEPDPRWKDLNDWIRDGKATDEELTKFFSVCIPAKPAFALSIRTGSELNQMTFDEDDNLLGDRILARGSKLVIAGQGGLGKSRILMQLAAYLMIQRDFGGLVCPGLRPEEKVLILQTENSTRRLVTDVKSMAIHVAMKAGKAEGYRFMRNLLIHTLETETDSFCYLNDKTARKNIEEVIKWHNPSVVMWDPLYTFTTGDLNADQGMAEVLSLITQVSKIGNADRAIVVAHHAQTGAAGREKATGHDRASFGRNSKVLHSWSRSQINVIAADEDNNNRLLLFCGKNNDGAEFKEFGMERFERTYGYEFFEVEDKADYLMEKKYKKSDLSSIPDDAVLSAVDDYPIKQDMIQFLVKKFNVDVSKANAKLKALRDAGKIYGPNGRLHVKR